MKPFIFSKWHVWQGTGDVIPLSDEENKKLRQFKTADDCINWLYLEAGDKEAARALNKHNKC